MNFYELYFFKSQDFFLNFPKYLKGDILDKLFGTSSKQFFREKGWQDKILLIVSMIPLKKPYFLIASKEYSEQDGIKRQDFGRTGLIINL